MEYVVLVLSVLAKNSKNLQNELVLLHNAVVADVPVQATIVLLCFSHHFQFSFLIKWNIMCLSLS